MKNSKLLLASLMILALISCDRSNDWTNDQKKTMKDHLYGEVLPFIDIGTAAFQFDRKSGLLGIIGTKMINKTTLKDYASLYKPDKGWENLNSSNGVWGNANSSSELYHYTFEKVIQKENPQKSIRIDFYVYNIASRNMLSEGENNGYFYLSAYGDQYEHEFPSDFFDEKTKSAGSKIRVPAYKAKDYLVSYSDSRYGDVGSVSCFTDDFDAQVKYEKILQNTHNYKLGNGSAVSKDNLFSLKYGYSEWSQCFSITLYIMPNF